MRKLNKIYHWNTGKGIMLLIVFCILIPLSGFTQKFLPEYNRKKPYILTQKDSSLFFNTKEDGIVRLHKGRFYYYYFHGKVLKTKGAYLGRLLDGEFVRLYGPGTLAEKGLFKNGLKKGNWKIWYNNGELKSEQVWKNGKFARVRFEYSLTGKKEKYVFKKEKWVLKAKKEKAPKKKSVLFKKKLSWTKDKKGEDIVADSILTKKNGSIWKSKKKKPSPKPLKETKEKIDPVAKNEDKQVPKVGEPQTTTGFLREHMAEYEQAKKLEPEKVKKTWRLRPIVKVKAADPRRGISEKGEDVKVIITKETPRRSNFFVRFWNKLKKNKSKTNEKNEKN